MIQPKKQPNKDKEVKEDAVTEIIKKSEELSRDWIERDIKKPEKKEDDKKENRVYEIFNPSKAPIF